MARKAMPRQPKLTGQQWGRAVFFEGAQREHLIKIVRR